MDDPDNKLEIEGFTFCGDQCFDPQESVCLAKKVYDKELGSTRYFVKANSGANLFNPLTSLREELSREDSSTGRRRYEFKGVSQSVYETYLRFLRLQNTSDLRRAEREMISG